MNFTRMVLRRPVTVIIVVLTLIIFGFTSIVGTPMELMPDIEMPMLIVVSIYPGAGPEEVEDLVTSQVEDAVSTLSGVKSIQSTSSDSLSLVMLEMEYGTNMDVAHMDLQENLDMINTLLPDDVESPTVIEISMDMMATITLAARATGDVDLLNYIDDEITPEFEKIGGVASVEVMGGSSDYISVELMEERMNQYHLDMSTIANFIGAANFSIPAGDVDRGDQSLSLRGEVDYNSVESLKTIPITLSTGQVIRLSDVANVYQATEEASSISRYNGEEMVMLSISKRQSASTLDVTRAVNQELERINAQNMGVQLEVINDTSEQILSSIQAVFSTLISAVILCMAVLFFFFGDWKASLIVGSSIPMSVLVTLILMNFAGFSLNVVSLGGLVIAVGMMVDNSIVVLESCFQRREQRMTYREAALEGTKIVTSSVIASTITTIVVFLPISIMEGLSGQMFQQLGFTIVFGLCASLVSALSLVPLLFYRLTPVEKDGWPVTRYLTKIEDVYGRFLKKTFRHKGLVVFVSVALLVISFAMMPFIHMELMPDIDQGMVSIEVDTKPGLKLEELDKTLVSLEEMVAASPDVERYSVSGGGGSMFSTSTADSSITVYLKDEREKSTDEWVDTWREQTKDYRNCEVTVSAQSMMTALTGGGNAQVNLQGNDLDVLREASLQVEELMRQHPDIVHVSSSLTSGDPQAEVVVDPIKATAAGLTPAQVVSSVYGVMSGTTPDTLRIDGHEYDIVVEYPKGSYETVADLSGLMINAPSGRQIPLLDVASIEYSNAPQSIDRRNNQYVVTITGQPTTAAQLTAPTEITQQVAQMELPTGVSISQNDMTESMNEEFSALFGALAVAVWLVFMVMAIQFESMRFSIIVMICIPFSLIGSLLLMLISQVTLSMVSLIGFLMLVGTVVNNGILFIDTANQYRGSMDAETALVYAGKSRLRPILMTTLTTVLSMIPMAMGIGDGAETMQGMAVVIVGGLTASTILTLLLLPTFYLLFRGKPHKEYENQEDIQAKKPKPELSQEELITH